VALLIVRIVVNESSAGAFGALNCVQRDAHA
jgi:hypothetical protein